MVLNHRNFFFYVCRRWLADLGKLNVVLGTCCESLILGSNLESGLCSLYITLTGGDDGLQVVLALALGVSKNIGGSIEVAVEDVDEGLVEAVCTFQLGSCVSIFAVELRMSTTARLY